MWGISFLVNLSQRAVFRGHVDVLAQMDMPAYSSWTMLLSLAVVLVASPPRNRRGRPDRRRFGRVEVKPDLTVKGHPENFCNR